MRLVFIDESGYTPDWKAGIDAQPFYVASAISFPASMIAQLYAVIREDIEALNLPGQPQPLGLGFEIKAGDIARGTGWWADHNEQRNHVRDLFLAAPRKFEGVAFVSAIDKKRHLARYAYPAEPYYLAMTFVLERLEKHLSDVQDHAYCVYDHNARIGSALQDYTAELIRDGSPLFYRSKLFNDFVLERFRLPHILELALGDSRFSVGLQVADYFATLAYHYYCDGKPQQCGWWDLLIESLHTKEGKLAGIGLKEFP